jgi:phosphohistidine phosphatase
MSDRTLVLLRHAKAENPDDYATDIERPLAPRGRADAAAAGRWLVDAGLKPDLVLCSSALRTRQTWEFASPLLGAVEVAYEPQLYTAGLPDAIKLVEQTRPEIGTLLVIGHNPTMSVLSAYLDPDGEHGDGLSTAGLAVHRVTTPWAQIESGGAELTRLHTARA